jgi:threonine/homoserine/homoserine lactone efflux protein
VDRLEACCCRASEGSASPIRIEPRQYARQAFLITLLNPKAIVFYMAFFPLFINPALHRGLRSPSPRWPPRSP